MHCIGGFAAAGLVVRRDPPSLLIRARPKPSARSSPRSLTARRVVTTDRPPHPRLSGRGGGGTSGDVPCISLGAESFRAPGYIVGGARDGLGASGGGMWGLVGRGHGPSGSRCSDVSAPLASSLVELIRSLCPPRPLHCPLLRSAVLCSAALCLGGSHGGAGPLPTSLISAPHQCASEADEGGPAFARENMITPFRPWTLV